jgi:hypothetical protein
MKTIKSRSKTGELMEVSGTVILLDVGGKKIKFLLQVTNTREVFLTHYASGRLLGSLTPYKLAAHRSYKKLTDRAAAVIMLEKLIEKHGLDRVLVIFNSAEQLN